VQEMSLVIKFLSASEIKVFFFSRVFETAFPTVSLLLALQIG
jgi:hypothetical protein